MRAATRERMISIMARGWPGGNPCFSAGLVRLPLVRGLLHGSTQECAINMTWQTNSGRSLTP